MKCRACLGEHAPWIRCEVAARQAINLPSINAPAINAPINEMKPAREVRAGVSPIWWGTPRRFRIGLKVTASS